MGCSPPLGCSTPRKSGASSFLLLGWLGLAWLGLGCSEPVTPAQQGHNDPAGGGVVPQIPAAEANSCDAPPRRGSSMRNAAIDALIAGKGQEATLGLIKVLQDQPNDHTAQALLVAARRRQDKLSQDVEAALRTQSATFLALPLKTLFQSNAVSPRAGAASVRLTRRKSAKNLIIDDGDWFQNNGLPRVLKGRPQADDLPDYLPRMYDGFPIDTLFDHGTHVIGKYGPSLVVGSPGMKPRAFTSPAPPAAQGVIGFAKLARDTIVVSLAQPTTSRLAAFDPASGALQWSSDEATSGAQSFELTRDHVVTGDGDTNKADAIFLIDAATGKTLQKEKIATAPSYLVLKGSELFVRSYDMDYVFTFSTPPEPSEPPAFSPAEALPAAVSQASRCAFERALAASDARDVSALASAVSELQSGKADPSLVGAFQGIGRFLEQQQRTAALDLTTVAPVVLPEPPWEYRLLDGSRVASARKVGLTKKSSTPGGKPWVLRRGDYQADKPWIIPPIEKGKLPPGARPDIPSQYGNLDLGLIIPDGERLILVYGGRYVAVTKGSTTEAVLDLEAYRHPPKVSAEWKEFAVGDVTYALTEGDTLFVANGGGSYAKEMFGKKAFMSAISLSSKKLLWRSEPLVAGPAPFAMYEEFLVTGYGFTSEPDHVFLLDKGTGKVAAKLAVDSAPDGIVVSGSRATVLTYESQIEIEITAPK